MINCIRNELFRMFFTIKNTKSIVVSFQPDGLIRKYFSIDSGFIQVPYNDFYSKVDQISENILNNANGAELVLLDCPMLSAALSPKLWESSDMSILDLGRTLNAARATVKYNDTKK